MSDQIPAHVSRQAMRQGLQRLLIVHQPVKAIDAPNDLTVFCSMQDGQWPCATFTSALLNLQFERLFDVINVLTSSMDADPVLQAAISASRRAQNGDSQKGKG